MAKQKSAMMRTSQGLRDVLFDEIEELRNGKGDPTKAAAVANLAKQIVNTAKAEMDFHRVLKSHEKDGQPILLGTLQLGSS